MCVCVRLVPDQARLRRGCLGDLPFAAGAGDGREYVGMLLARSGVWVLAVVELRRTRDCIGLLRLIVPGSDWFAGRVAAAQRAKPLSYFVLDKFEIVEHLGSVPSSQFLLARAPLRSGLLFLSLPRAKTCRASIGA